MRFRLLALAVLVFPACNGANTRERDTCAIYQSFYEYWPVPARQEIRFVRQARPYNTNGQQPIVSFEPGLFRDPENMHPPEFAEDTSAYFDQLGSGPGVVSDCFRREGPTFIDQSDDREAFLDANREIRWIVTLSPVAIAPDGRHALMWANIYCGVMCAQEHFVLFERQGSEWNLKGNRLGMIS